MRRSVDLTWCADSRALERGKNPPVKPVYVFIKIEPAIHIISSYDFHFIVISKRLISFEL